MRLHVQSHGQAPEQVPPLVCLHGFLGSGDNLWPLADSLKAERKSLLMDLRGHGKSPHGRPYTLEGMADDVAETLHAEGVKKAAVLGHSLGGKVAMTLALRHPELVERLIIADITVAQVDPHYDPLLDAMAETPVATLTRREEAEPHLHEAEPNLETRRFLLKNLQPNAEGPGFHWRFDLEGLKADHPKVLAQVAQGKPYPHAALLIHGDKSELVTPEGIEATKKFFPKLQVITLPGGHWIHVDAREPFNHAVHKFLVHHYHA
jgi:pimeloyl-ACP methyl ester carboxylesterase